MSPKLKPVSTGKLYTIDNIGFVRNVVPTISLEDNHPFYILWQSFLSDITNGCATFWDAMMSIYTGHTAFAGNRAEIQQLKAIYLNNPPNVVIADMQSEELYGRHRQVTCLWQFIYISKCYVDHWAAAEDETSMMGYEALLKATLVHESAHWAQTLRVGLYPNLTQDEADNLSPHEQLKLKKKMTPKRFQTFAAQGASGEAGYYVEVTVFGGVVFLQHGNLAIATSNTCVNRVSVNALREIKRLGLCQLVSLAAPLPNPTLLSPTPICNRQGAPATLCDSESDDEELFSNHCPREYPVLDRIAAISFEDDQIDEDFDNEDSDNEDFDNEDSDC